MEQYPQQTTTDVQSYERAVATFAGGAEILSANITLAEKAVNAGNTLRQEIATQGMSKEYDDKCNRYLVLLKERLTGMNEKRKGITQLMDSVKSMFTKPEAEMAGQVTAIQALRNEYAKKLAEDAKIEVARLAREKAREQELADVRAYISLSMSNHFLNEVSTLKSRLQTSFNMISLETAEKQSAGLRSYDATQLPTILDVKSHPKYSPMMLTTIAEYEALFAQESETWRDKYADRWGNEIGAFKRKLIEQLPSKIEELKALQEADKTRAYELNLIKEQREKEQAQDLQDEITNKLIEAKRVVDATAQTEKVMSSFAEVVEAPATVKRSGYEITVNSPAGWVLLFERWFHAEAVKLNVEEIGNRKMNQVKSWNEKDAHKTGTKIESMHLSYEETFNVKATK